MGRAILRGGEGATRCEVHGHSAVVYAKAAEPIEMSFGLRTRVVLGNHVLDGGTDTSSGDSNFGGKKTSL